VQPPDTARASASEAPVVDTASRILDAAERCMGRRGLRVSVNDVAEEAGLARRTIYHHFPNRDALVGAVLHRTAQAFVTAIEPYVNQRRTLAGQVAEAAVQITQHREDVEFTLVSPTRRSDSLLAVVLTFHLDRLIASLVDFWVPRVAKAQERGEVHADLDGRHVAESIIRFTFSFALMPPVVVDLDDDAAVRRFVRNHLRGITT
jgi:AcrR family transcriptional regulator